MFTSRNRFLRLSNREQSRSLDTDTIQSFGIESHTLMEIAGLKASGIIREHTGEGLHGLFICGKGNNAGDAFVGARYLLETAGHNVTILLVAGDDDFSPDASGNYGLLKKLSGHAGNRINFETDYQSIDINNYDYVVDGMIGTGLSSNLRAPLDSVVEWLNNGTSMVFALDIPTGLDCDTGKILGKCVRADFTITFGTNKAGFYLNDGPDVSGMIRFADLPFPEHLRKHTATLINKELLEEIPMDRPNAVHKYQKGTVHIVAGSEGMTGAAIMAAKSAWKTGAGAVFLYAPRGILNIYEQTLPQIIKKPVGKPDDNQFTPEAVEDIVDNISNKNGPVLVGPGIGLSEKTRTFLAELLPNIDQPVILDADGLSAWKDLSGLDVSNWILTPHPGELKNYFNIHTDSDAKRLNKIKELSESAGCRVLSKGSPTLLHSPLYGSFITGYNTNIFARAGFGDVLAGTIAGNLAVSRNTDHSILEALITNFLAISDLKDPEPGNIYDR